MSISSSLEISPAVILSSSRFPLRETPTVTFGEFRTSIRFSASEINTSPTDCSAGIPSVRNSYSSSSSSAITAHCSTGLKAFEYLWITFLTTVSLFISLAAISSVVYKENSLSPYLTVALHVTIFSCGASR